MQYNQINDNRNEMHPSLSIQKGFQNEVPNHIPVVIPHALGLYY
jgi:hypothetical protein